MGKTIGQNSDLLDEIAAKYGELADDIEEAIKKVKEAKKDMLVDYDGQGKELSDDTLKKLKEHLTFLKDCLLQTSIYVTYSKQTMEEMDESIANDGTQG